MIEVVEINITDKCNRSCHFCPQSTLGAFSDSVAITHDMSRDTIDAIAKNLKLFDDDFTVSFSGFGSHY